MAYALITNVSAGLGQNGGTTGGVDTTGADLIVVNVAYYTAASPTLTGVTDSKGNGSYTALTARVGAEAGTKMFYIVPSSVGSGHTFTVTGTNIYASVQVSAWSGAHASPFDQENGATAATNTVISTGSITPSEDDCLVIAGLGSANNTGGAVSINGGFTITNTNAYNVGVSVLGSMAYLIQTSATAANPQWNVTNVAATLAAAIASFKPAGGGGGGGRIFKLAGYGGGLVGPARGLVG